MPPSKTPKHHEQKMRTCAPKTRSQTRKARARMCLNGTPAASNVYIGVLSCGGRTFFFGERASIKPGQEFSLGSIKRASSRGHKASHQNGPPLSPSRRGMLLHGTQKPGTWGLAQMPTPPQY